MPLALTPITGDREIAIVTPSRRCGGIARLSGLVRRLNRPALGVLVVDDDRGPCVELVPYLPDFGGECDAAFLRTGPHSCLSGQHGCGCHGVDGHHTRVHCMREDHARPVLFSVSTTPYQRALDPSSRQHGSCDASRCPHGSLRGQMTVASSPVALDLQPGNASGPRP